MSHEHEKFMARAIELAQAGVDEDLGGPFGCVIVKDGAIVGEGNNRVTSTLDPTAHAEIVAIREACENLHSFQLEDCVIYTSCEPCPMCLGAIYWARVGKLYFASTREDAAAAGFDDSSIYAEIPLPAPERRIPMVQTMREEGAVAFEAWAKAEGKIPY